jgi:hypothetical protein
MTKAELDRLLASATDMAARAEILSRTMAMIAASEKQASRQAIYHRLHMVLTDAAINLRHAIDAAPTMVQK